jgi:hypothetical protein
MPRRLLFGRFVFDVFNDVADRLQLFGVFIRYFDRKFLFKRHDQLDDIQRIRTQIFDERRRWCDLLWVHPQLLDDDVLNLLFDWFLRHKICSVRVGCAWQA